MGNQSSALPLLIGPHVSIAGGIEKAFARAAAVGATAMQIFTGNASRWQAKPLTPAAIAAFKLARSTSIISYVAVHDSYLINLASPDAVLRKKSIDSFVAEMQRCHQLGIEDLVMHPGAHMQQGVAAGIRQLVESFKSAFSQAPGTVRVLLENTAGQGSCLGARFEELAEILARLPEANLAICFDTCHAFAAGYDLTSEDAYATTMVEFERLIGCQRLALFHLNDSKKELGARVDRHQHVGQGAIGAAGFRALLQDVRFADRAKIIETPSGEQHCHDLENLARLRYWARGR